MIQLFKETCYLSEWLNHQGQPKAFETFQDRVLAELLESFYKETYKTESGRSGVKIWQDIRDSINRYVRRFRVVDIVIDRPFAQANKAFFAAMRKAVSNSEILPISDEDWSLLHNSPVLDSDTPEGLQNRVFVNLVSHFGCVPLETVSRWTKDMFVIFKDSRNIEYVQGTQEYKMLARKDSDVSNAIMIPQGNSNCPVKSFKKYLSKLDPDCDLLFTCPKTLDKLQPGSPWYSSKPLSSTQYISTKMKSLSQKCGLSRLYTNICLTKFTLKGPYRTKGLHKIGTIEPGKTYDPGQYKQSVHYVRAPPPPVESTTPEAGNVIIHDQQYLHSKVVAAPATQSVSQPRNQTLPTATSTSSGEHHHHQQQEKLKEPTREKKAGTGNNAPAKEGTVQETPQEKQTAGTHASEKEDDCTDSSSLYYVITYEDPHSP